MDHLHEHHKHNYLHVPEHETKHKVFVLFYYAYKISKSNLEPKHASICIGDDILYDIMPN